MAASISRMEPLLPGPRRELDELAAALLRKSSALGEGLHPITRAGLVDLLREMNSYYSNLIEGHRTRPRDIEKAMRRDFSRVPEQKALQLESIAHIRTQQKIEERLASEPDLDVCSTEFLCWIHGELYKDFPPEFLVVTSKSGRHAAVKPGKLRHLDVELGAHLPPEHQDLPRFLSRFAEVYDQRKLAPLERIVATGAAHHRLAWIHPFLDGNGRVARLFTHAWLIRAKVSGHGLWMVSRGLARSHDAYFAGLATADQPRRGDYDGRGNLTESGLAEFCAFFLETMLDQIDFMSKLLQIESFWKRIHNYVRIRAGELPEESAALLTETLYKGEVARGEAGRIMGMSDRSAREIIGQLLAERLLVSGTPKGKLRLGFPAQAVPWYFPDLYPPEDFSEI
ncbi:MAG: Fic family protein [Myxococcales bacterium]